MLPDSLVEFLRAYNLQLLSRTAVAHDVVATQYAVGNAMLEFVITPWFDSEAALVEWADRNYTAFIKSFAEAWAVDTQDGWDRYLTRIRGLV